MNEKLKNCKNLEQLLELLQNETVDENSGWGEFEQYMCDLPKFGGEEPANTAEVWSWDAKNLLIGEGKNDLEIVSRGDYE